MTILVIDDLRWFKFDAEYARTSQEGIDALEIQRGYDGLDELWLDHDLGLGDTIMPVVNYLCELSFKGMTYPVKQVYVHSANPSGAKIVWQTLERYGYSVERRRAWDYEDYSKD